MTFYPVKIGDVTLGETPSEVLGSSSHWFVGASPNPVKVTWRRTNRVKVHEIPYPSDKTIRTSKRTLYTCMMNFKTIEEDKFNQLLEYCENKILVLVDTYHKKMQMYIIEYSFDEAAAYDDNYIDWNITFQEAND